MNNETRKTVLVTGGGGFLGNVIRESLDEDVSEKYDFMFVDRSDADLLDINETRRLFRELRPTIVLQLASTWGGLYKNINHQLDMLITNQRINQNVIECANEFPVTKCITCFSGAAFPEICQYPMNESMLHAGAPNAIHLGYAHSVRYVDILNKCYNASNSVTIFMSVILCNLYGPHDNFNIYEGHVVGALIQKAFMSSVNDQNLLVCGSGEPLRQFLYAEDAALFLLHVIDDYESPEPIILSVDPSSEVSIMKVAKIIHGCFNLKKEIILEKSLKEGQHRRTLDNSKMKALWPNFEFTTLEEGINRTISWFIENRDTARN